MNLVEELRDMHNCAYTYSEIADLIEKYYFSKPLFEDGDPVDINSEFLWESPNGKLAPAVAKVCEIRIDEDGYEIESADGYLVCIKNGDKRVKKPVSQVTLQDIESYLEENAVNYLRSNGNGMYEDAKMVSLDVVENAMNMMRNLYEK